jgi:hypothetical protein
MAPKDKNQMSNSRIIGIEFSKGFPKNKVELISKSQKDILTNIY